MILGHPIIRPLRVEAIRRRAPPRRVVIGAIALLSAALPTAATACRCVEPGLGAAYNEAEGVALATVESIERRSDFDVSYTLAVSQAWKRPLGERLTIVSRGTCIYRAEVGHKYLLYLRSYERGGYQTGRCMGNAPETNASRALNFLRAKGR
jgi:hypothetical protein